MSVSENDNSRGFSVAARVRNARPPSFLIASYPPPPIKNRFNRPQHYIQAAKTARTANILLPCPYIYKTAWRFTDKIF
jgi:hypothetical protein